MNDCSFIELLIKSIYAELERLLYMVDLLERDIILNQSPAKPKTARRTASKQQRQVQLIKATIRSIAKHGLSVTTMSTVAREAGLSQGIINLHFKSKDRLLEETLLYVVDEYRTEWHKALENSGDSAVEKLVSMLGVDFDKRICQRNKLAVWFAFWGESRSRLTYRKIYSEREREYKQVLSGLCEDIRKQGGYGTDVRHIVAGLSSMHVGLWLDLLLTPAEMNRDEALSISRSYLAAVFPRHFPV